MKQIKGLYQANCDMPIKYSFRRGGGIKGRTIKQGDYINAIGTMSDVNSHSVSTLETLHRIELNYFLSHFTYIGKDLNDLPNVIASLIPGGQKISFSI